jgi:selenocysteine-specific elongation factor
VSDEVVERVLAALGENETAKPWAFGMTSLGLARLLEVEERVLVAQLAVPLGDGRIALRDGYYATPAFVPGLSAEQRAFFDRAFAPDPARRNAPLASRTLTAALRSARIPGLDLAFETLLASGELVRVGDDLYRREQVAAIRAALETELRTRGHVTVAQFRDAIGTSRRYAVPLLEWFDAQGVTVRDGDNRFPAPVPAPFTIDEDRSA